MSYPLKFRRIKTKRTPRLKNRGEYFNIIGSYVSTIWGYDSLMLSVNREVGLASNPNNVRNRMKRKKRKVHKKQNR